MLVWAMKARVISGPKYEMIPEMSKPPIPSNGQHGLLQEMI